MDSKEKFYRNVGEYDAVLKSHCRLDGAGSQEPFTNAPVAGEEHLRPGICCDASAFNCVSISPCSQ